MLAEIFYWLFNMSIAASVTGCVLLLLRRIRWVPRRVTAALWAIPFLRMWIPVGIGSDWGLLPLLSRITTRTVTVFFPGTGEEFPMSNWVRAANRYFPITYKTELLAGVFSAASAVWAVVGGAIALTLVILYVTTLREIRDARPLRGRVYVSDKVTAPALYGVFRPKIVVSSATAEEGGGFWLLHEQTHLKRGDNLWRILAFATAALHWFNPLAWVFLKCFLADLELACDEGVLRSLTEEERKGYALALVAEAENKTLFVSAFGGAKLKTRIERILSFKKMTAVSFGAFALVAGAVGYLLLTNPT